MIKKLLTILFIVLFQTIVLAQTNTYTGANGNWNVAASWSLGQVPTASHDVVIPFGKTVTITVNAFANNLSVIGTGILTINDKITLTIYGNVTVDSGARFNAGTGNDDSALIKVYGDFKNDGTANFWKSTVVIGGNLITASTILQNNGNIIVGGNVSGIIGGSGSGIVYPVNPNATVTVIGSADEKPAGTLPTDNTLVDLMNEVIFGGSCPFIISNIVNVSACLGSNATFTSSATGTNPVYMWQVNMGSGWINLGNGVTYAGVSTATLTITGVTAAMNNYKYRIRVTVNSCTKNGNYGVLTVNPLPVITAHPINQLDCEKRLVSFRVTASGSGLSYSWQRKKPTESAFVTIPIGESNTSNATTNEISISNVGSTQYPNGTQFQVIVFNGICSATSNIATLTVNEITALTPTNEEITQCFGTNYSYTVSTTYPLNVVSYQWKSSVASGLWNDVVDGIRFSGAKTTTLTIIGGTPDESAKYRVYITFNNSTTQCSVDSSSRTRQITFLPQVPTPLAFITQPTCAVSTGSFTITNYNASYTYAVSPSAGVTRVDSMVTVPATATSYTVTANSGSCTSNASAPIVIKSVETTTFDGTNWSSVPDITKIGIINVSGTITADVILCSCIVNAGVVATVARGKTIKLLDKLEVSGELIFEDDASLVQINDAAVNTGNITYNRDSSPMKKFDFTYWSSPVTPQTLFNLSPFTNWSQFFSFDAAVQNWKRENSSAAMAKGIGYIIRAPDNNATPPPPPVLHQGVFIGVPNNGPVAVSIPFTTPATYNLIGNPYPSALDADLFLLANEPILEGTLYFWTHNTAIQLASGITNGSAGSGTYAYTSDDYASYNKVGGVATKSDLIGGLKPSGKIASGQGFFALGKAAGNVVFNNSMRLAIDPILLLDNTQFFRTTTSSKSTSIIEKHRVWLNLTNSQGAFKQMLVGYLKDATNGYDKAFDGQSFNGNQFVDFYSINDNKNFTIQGRALPFDKNDRVQLGYRSSIEGVFTISIDQVDGILASQDVFIEDKITNTVHNLKVGGYEFTTKIGSFNDRFVLSFAQKTVATNNLKAFDNSVLISGDKNELKIKSELESIQRITVFDLLGRKVFDKDAVNSTEFRLANSMLNKQIVIVKVTLSNGKVISKKVIY